MTASVASPTVSCKRASAPIGEPVATARALRAQLGDGPHALVAYFASPKVDRAALAASMLVAFPESIVVGCSTAGEIGPDGLVEGTVSAVALAKHTFEVVTVAFDDVRTLEVSTIHGRAQQALARLQARGIAPTADNTFALLLIDGLSVAEERFANAVNAALGDIPLVGGSAGDGLDFVRTHVDVDGEAHAHGAVLVLVHSQARFEVFKTQHFVCGSQRMVVTAADQGRRIVHQINGEPAALALANAFGLDVQHLDPMAFATHPVVVRMGGDEYVRSIQKVEADGSLTFYCAIEEGVVLRGASGAGLVDNLRAALARVEQRIGQPELVLAFDCILRRLECQRLGVVDEVSAMLRAANCSGFSTYGEQFRGMHVNQTLTGVAIGARR